MNTKVEICHIDSNRCVVRVSCVEGELDLGSAVGEAADAEQAEDRARARLMERRLKTKAPSGRQQPDLAVHPTQKEEMGEARQRKAPINPEKNKPKRSEPLPLPIQQNQATERKDIAIPTANPIAEPSEAPTDPDDWSEELTAIDLQLKRIGWTRDHEKIFLERAYGNGSRHKLTRYSDLVSYLNKLNSLEVGAEAESVPTPLRRSALITQGDEMLTTLKWNQEQAKTFLQSKLGATSRQQLSDEQLLEFNILLEEQLISEMPNKR